MKNIIIVGPPRVGKTTLSKMIINQISCFSVINLDVIRESIYKSIYCNMGKKERKKLVKDIFPTFLRTMLRQYTSYYNPDLFYVIEGDIISIENSLKIKKEYDVDIICVGTPNIKEQDLFDRIRMNASLHGCWTEEYSDDELHKLCSEIIDQSKKEMMISLNNNLTYLDNSYNNKCLQNYINILKYNLKFI